MSVLTAGRVNLSGIAKKPEKTKAAYPVITEARAVELADLVLRLTDEAEAVNANLDINKAELRSLAVPEFFQRFAGRVDVPSSLAVPATDGREVLISLTARYKKPTDLAALVALLGEDKAEAYLKSSFKLEIDSAKIPVEKQQEVVDRLAAVLGEYGCSEALTATESIAPTEAFHTARHTAFTPQRNMEIENIMPMTVAIKTKGRGSK